MPLTTMTDRRKEIHDDEVRVIGRSGGDAVTATRRRKGSLLLVSIALIAAVCASLIIFWPKNSGEASSKNVAAISESVPDPLGITTDRTFTERIDTIIGSVRLAIYLPHNATPALSAGLPAGSGVILAARAADVRADNGKINEAFVCEGKALAFGLSKKGYCAILGGEVTIGVADDSPLFEEAIESGGYFFRQYPLVDDGIPVMNESMTRTKTMRRAVCIRSSQVFIAVSESDESFDDFAAALAVFGVEKAIYITGGHESGGWWVGLDGTDRLFDSKCRTGIYENETYIFWR